jgi:mono/diheme cytochrome c family protein
MRWSAGFLGLLLLLSVRSAFADSVGRQLYRADCARCHGADGKGAVPAMREVKGYHSVDLTQLSKQNGGQFPRQEILDAIEGSKRFPAHLTGGMPIWGHAYGQGEPSGPNADSVRKKISALTDYIESIQEK